MTLPEMKYLVFFVVLLAVFSCKRDRPDIVNTSYKQLPGKKILICNEGNFGSGNAGLSIYNLDFDTIQNNTFQAVNNQIIGDVLESVCVWHDKMYLAVNNSHRIIMIDKESLQFMAATNIQSPRKIIVDDATNQLYVSSLYNNKVYVLDALTLNPLDSISLPYKNTEGLLLYNQYLYVAVWDTSCSSVYKVDVKQKLVIDSLETGNAPHALLLDKDNHLWVFSGNIVLGYGNQIHQYDLNSDTLIKSFSFGTTVSEMIKPTMNLERDSLYWLGVNYTDDLDNGVYVMSVVADELPLTPIIKGLPLQYFWGLYVYSDKIFVSDPKGFLQNGDLLIYNKSGELLDKKSTGLGTGNLFFTE